jgi:hypothetical protein
MRNIEVRTAQPDQRPAFVLDSVTGADFSNIRVDEPQGVSQFSLKNVSDFSVRGSRPTPDTHIDKADQQTV